MNRLMLGPNSAAHRSVKVNGRTYAANAGQPLTVPDYDAAQLAANSWIDVAPTGTTAQRPLPSANAGITLAIGNLYYDITLSVLIVWDGLAWRNPANGNAV